LLISGIGISSQSNADSIAVAPAAPTKIGIFEPAVLAGEIDAAIASKLVAEKLADPRLGSGVTAYVIDANSGKVLVDINGEQAMIPASTLKIFTGIAAMNVLGAQTRFETVVKREGSQLTIIIVRSVGFLARRRSHRSPPPTRCGGGRRGLDRRNVF
jgi:D-alanyl-D-alanine carboxypeptidase